MFSWLPGLDGGFLGWKGIWKCETGDVSKDNGSACAEPIAKSARVRQDTSLIQEFTN